MAALPSGSLYKGIPYTGGIPAFGATGTAGIRTWTGRCLEVDAWSVETDGADPQLARDRALAYRALRRWESFPVERKPRPLVLLAGPTKSEHGFRSGAAKIAFLHGDIESMVSLPDGLIEVMPTRTHRLLGTCTERLLITDAQPEETVFATDRGDRSLPAWRLTGPGINGALWVLDPSVAASRWVRPKSADSGPHRGIGATLERDQVTLHFIFTGYRPEDGNYPDAEVIESPQAVVVLPHERYVGPPGPRLAGPGYGRTVVVNLATALGARALIDLDASPARVEAHQPDTGLTAGVGP